MAAPMLSTHDIPAETTEMWKDVFTAFVDGAAEDPTIPAKVVGKAIRAAGQCPTNDQLNNMVEEMIPGAETDPTARVTFQQFERLMVQALNEFKTEETLRAALRDFDKDNSGFINISEFRHFMTSIGDPLEPEEMQELIAECQAGACFDSAGVNLSIDEFIKKFMPPLVGQP
eukprot:TRINITY_DN3953_c0_g1_i1.p3 TRINITY_DN3953_c0_g1~~TRINITY_DN3953_c0_g1_i1.p3  ORF type:complete len:172 (+),score=72.11 TRINITY_DN3953_c0_g1_i1:93-608(+)